MVDDGTVRDLVCADEPAGDPPPLESNQIGVGVAPLREPVLGGAEVVGELSVAGVELRAFLALASFARLSELSSIDD